MGIAVDWSMRVRRHYVNLLSLAHDGGYILRPFNAWTTLFYPSTLHADKATRSFYQSTLHADIATAAAKKEFNANANPNGDQLPGTAVKLRGPSVQVGSFTGVYPRTLNLLGLMGTGSDDKGRILFSDADGHTLGYQYDRDLRFTGSMPTLNHPKIYPASVSLGDHQFYVMDTASSCSFEALTSCPNQRWSWQSLPPPPFAPSPIASYTVIHDLDDDSSNSDNNDESPAICVSAMDGDTYLFNTRTHVWSCASECDVLPFHGKAEYVSELDLWFGFTKDSPHHLCAADLFAANPGNDGDDSDQDSDDDEDEQHVFQDFDPPEGWKVVKCRLVSLGAGKFCIAKFLHEGELDKDGSYSYDAVVLIGVEVVRGQYCSDPSFQLIKHKSTHYVEPFDEIL